MLNSAELISLLYKINFTAAVFALILWSSMLFGMAISKKVSTSNNALKIFIPALCIQFLCIPIVTIIIFIYYIFNLNLTPLLELILHCFISFGGNSLRWGTLILCFDRIIATYFLKFYIYYGNTKLFGVILTLMSSMISFLMILFHILGASGTSTTTYFALVVNFLCIIVILFLIRKNQKLRHLIDNNYTLSGKFQIVENIRSLEVIEIYLILMVLITSCSPICTTLYSAFLPQYPFTGRSPIFYFFYNIFFCITAVVVGIRIKTMKTKKVFKTFVRSRIVKVEDGKRPRFSSSSKAEVDVYFASLKNSWDQKLIK